MRVPVRVQLGALRRFVRLVSRRQTATVWHSRHRPSGCLAVAPQGQRRRRSSESAATRI